MATRNAAALGGDPLAPAWALMRPVFAVGAGAPDRWRAHARPGEVAVPPLPAIVPALTMLALAPMATWAATLMAQHRTTVPIARFVQRHARSQDLVVHEGPIETSGALEVVLGPPHGDRRWTPQRARLRGTWPRERV